jgi:Flp pilus assembly protein TadB
VTGAALALALVVPFTAVLAGAMVVATQAARRRRRSRQRRRLEEATALQAAMDVLVGELRVGAHPAAAFDAAATEVRGAVGVSLRSVGPHGRDSVLTWRRVCIRSPGVRRCRHIGSGSRCPGTWLKRMG